MQFRVVARGNLINCVLDAGGRFLLQGFFYGIATSLVDEQFPRRVSQTVAFDVLEQDGLKFHFILRCQMSSSVSLCPEGFLDKHLVSTARP